MTSWLALRLLHITDISINGAWPLEPEHAERAAVEHDPEAAVTAAFAALAGVPQLQSDLFSDRLSEHTVYGRLASNTESCRSVAKVARTSQCKVSKSD